MTDWAQLQVEREQQEKENRENIADFAAEILKERLGVVHAWEDEVVVWKYGVTADDIVNMVEIGDKFNLIGRLQHGKNAPSGGDSIDVVFRPRDSRT